MRRKPGCSRACARSVLNCREDWGWLIRWQAYGGVASCRQNAKYCWSWISSSSGCMLAREENTELVAALRHCDGEHVQAIVMVRDDFWLAASRFMRDLEIRLVEGENTRPVDLFDPRHARKVLVAFGRAFGALPENIGDHQQRPRIDFWINRFPGLPRTGRSSRSGWLSSPRWSKGNPGPQPRSKKWAAPRESV